MIRIILLVAFVVGALGGKWYSLKTWNDRYGIQPPYDEPRTLDAAKTSKFEEYANGCGSDASHSMPGLHVIQKDHPEIGLIFDARGFIAGIRSVVPAANITYEPNYRNQFYVKETINNVEVYVVTAYFVDPAKVCIGRTAEEFEEQGTGTDLYLVSGPIPTPENLWKAPPNASAVTAQDGIYKNYCLPKMGDHYFNFNAEHPLTAGDCSDSNPFSVRYEHQPPHLMNGVTFTHAAYLRGSRWEFVPKVIITTYLWDIPDCYLDMIKPTDGGISMHVWFGEANQTCGPLPASTS